MRKVTLNLISVVFFALALGFLYPLAEARGASLGPVGGSIGNVAVDPNHPNIVYVGTGGAGVFKSTDKGEHWSSINAGLTTRTVATPVIDPKDSTTIYATSSVGVFKSTNGGENWSEANTGLSSSDIRFLAINHTDPTILYAANSNSLFKSTNAGESWFGLGVGGRQNFWAFAVDSQGNTIYVAYVYSLGPLGGPGSGIIKSTDGGGHWLELSLRIYGFIWALAVDPFDSNTIYASTGDRYDIGGEVIKSTNGGETWSGASNGLANRRVGSLVIDPLDSSIIYVSTGDGIFKSTNKGESWSPTGWTVGAAVLTIDPKDSNTIYASTPGGLFRTTNGGKEWIEIDAGLTAWYVYSLVIDPKDSNTIYAGTSGTGGVFKSTNGGKTWSETNTGLTDRTILSLAVDPKDSNRIFAATARGIVKSTNGGERWSEILGSRYRWSILPLALAPTDSDTIYVGLENVYKSTDGGESWARTALTYPVAALAIDPKDLNTVYAGANNISVETRTDGIYKTTDGGGRWSEISTGLTYRSVVALAINPIDSHTIYAGTSGGGVFKSTDGGAHWSAVNTGLTNQVITSLAIDPKNPSMIYVSTSEGGVFKSTDGGERWFEANSGLENRSILSLAIDPIHSNTVYVGTAGNSIFVSYNSGQTWDGQTESWSGIPNGDFEVLGENGLPAHWQIVWHNAGSGTAFQYDNGGADAFQGNSVLRLHVDPGGGSTFVLSDAIPVAPATTYRISSWMRFNLASDADAVFFSVIQFDNEGNAVGFDEVRGRQGENFWSWQSKRLLVRTRPDASSIRIRFGLVSASASYLDVDAVR